MLALGWSFFCRDWVAVVTFAGPDLAKFIDRVLPDEPVKAKVVNRRHR